MFDTSTHTTTDGKLYDQRTLKDQYPNNANTSKINNIYVLIVQARRAWSESSMQDFRDEQEKEKDKPDATIKG